MSRKKKLIIIIAVVVILVLLITLPILLKKPTAKEKYINFESETKSGSEHETYESSLVGKVEVDKDDNYVTVTNGSSKTEFVSDSILLNGEDGVESYSISELMNGHEATDSNSGDMKADYSSFETKKDGENKVAVTLYGSMFYIPDNMAYDTELVERSFSIDSNTTYHGYYGVLFGKFAYEIEDKYWDKSQVTLDKYIVISSYSEPIFLYYDKDEEVDVYLIDGYINEYIHDEE